MPVGIPPLGGPLGRSRMRISASGYVNWQRCPRKWFIGSKIGLRGPVNPRMVMGIVVEDALVGLMMESPLGNHIPNYSRWAAWHDDGDQALEPSPEINSLDELSTWIHSKVDSAVDKLCEIGQKNWDDTPYRTVDYSWSDLDPSELANMIKGGLELFLEEVEQCYTAKGGPMFSHWRSEGDPHRTPAPRWDDRPCFPIPSKVKGLSLRKSREDEKISPLKGTGDISWAEAWEVARPWMKDPRVWQSQRLYHPAGWAAGEMDLALRWRGKTTIIDIKASDGTSKYAEGLQHQLAFYRFLWEVTRTADEVGDTALVESCQGWYLKGPIRKEFEVMNEVEVEQLGKELHTIWQAMTSADSRPDTWPQCTCGECNDFAESEDDGHIIIHGNEVQIPPRWHGLSLEEIIDRLSPRQPATPLKDIQSRINVVGRLGGKWGPLSNHFGELVHGAVLQSGGQSHAILEEMTTGAFANLRVTADGDYLFRNVAPGLWRSKTRLYLDGRSEIVAAADIAEDEHTTRLGLIQTRANVDALVVGRSKRSGQRVDGKPWTMVTAHLWDGERVIEIAAFGRSIVSTLAGLFVGDRVLISSAELGWRAGLPQLRVNPRITRMEVTPTDWEAQDGYPSQNL